MDTDYTIKYFFIDAKGHPIPFGNNPNLLSEDDYAIKIIYDTSTEPATLTLIDSGRKIPGSSSKLLQLITEDSEIDDPTGKITVKALLTKSQFQEAKRINFNNASLTEKQLYINTDVQAVSETLNPEDYTDTVLRIVCNTEIDPLTNSEYYTLTLIGLTAPIPRISFGTIHKLITENTVDTAGDVSPAILTSEQFKLVRTLSLNKVSLNATKSVDLARHIQTLQQTESEIVDLTKIGDWASLVKWDIQDYPFLNYSHLGTAVNNRVTAINKSNALENLVENAKKIQVTVLNQTTTLKGSKNGPDILIDARLNNDCWTLKITEPTGKKFLEHTTLTTIPSPTNLVHKLKENLGQEKLLLMLPIGKVQVVELKDAEQPIAEKVIKAEVKIEAKDGFLSGLGATTTIINFRKSNEAGAFLQRNTKEAKEYLCTYTDTTTEYWSNISVTIIKDKDSDLYSLEYSCQAYTGQHQFTLRGKKLLTTNIGIGGQINVEPQELQAKIIEQLSQTIDRRPSATKEIKLEKRKQLNTTLLGLSEAKEMLNNELPVPNVSAATSNFGRTVARRAQKITSLLAREPKSSKLTEPLTPESLANPGDSKTIIFLPYSDSEPESINCIKFPDGPTTPKRIAVTIKRQADADITDSETDDRKRYTIKYNCGGKKGIGENRNFEQLTTEINTAVIGYLGWTTVYYRSDERQAQKEKVEELKAKISFAIPEINSGLKIVSDDVDPSETIESDDREALDDEYIPTLVNGGPQPEFDEDFDVPEMPSDPLKHVSEHSFTADPALDDGDENFLPNPAVEPAGIVLAPNYINTNKVVGVLNFVSGDLKLNNQPYNMALIDGIPHFTRYSPFFENNASICVTAEISPAQQADKYIVKLASYDSINQGQTFKTIPPETRSISLMDADIPSDFMTLIWDHIKKNRIYNRTKVADLFCNDFRALRMLLAGCQIETESETGKIYIKDASAGSDLVLYQGNTTPVPILEPVKNNTKKRNFATHPLFNCLFAGGAAAFLTLAGIATLISAHTFNKEPVRPESDTNSSTETLLVSSTSSRNENTGIFNIQTLKIKNWLVELVSPKTANPPSIPEVPPALPLELAVETPVEEASVANPTPEPSNDNELNPRPTYVQQLRPNGPKPLRGDDHYDEISEELDSLNKTTGIHR